MTDEPKPDPNQIGEGELTPEQLVYKENILDHFRNPRNKKLLENATHHAKDKNPFCGDEIEVFLIVDDGVVVDVGFQGQGCAISQASMSMLTKKLKEMRTAQVHQISQDEILDMLKIPIGIVRRKCAMLGLRVTQEALKEKEESHAAD